MAKLSCLLREQNEDGLGDFLCLVWVADAAQGNGIHQIDVPGYQRSEGFVGMIFGVLSQLYAVVRWLHSPVSVRPAAKTDNSFAFRPDHLIVSKYPPPSILNLNPLVPGLE